MSYEEKVKSNAAMITYTKTFQIIDMKKLLEERDLSTWEDPFINQSSV
jgi:hypothetical protein